MSRKGGPRKPTKFPDVISTLPDGTDGTLEDLLKEFGVVPVPKEELSKVLNGETSSLKGAMEYLNKMASKTDTVYVEVNLEKPQRMPYRIWKAEFFQDFFRWILRNYAIIKVINKENPNDQRIVYDPKRDKQAKEAQDKKSL